MRKLVLFIGLITFVFTASIAQSDYTQVEVMSLTPKADKVDLFKKGLTAHNKKFHPAGSYHASVSYNVTGPNSGSYNWFMGPTTWTQMDGRPGKGEHDLDWDKNVTPYVQSTGAVSYWRLNKDVNYQPEGAPATMKSRLRFYYVKPGQMDRYVELLKKMVEVSKATKSKMSTQLWTHYGFTDGPNAVTVSDFANWAVLDAGAGSKYWEEFEKVHGTGSWDRFIEELDLCLDRSKSFEVLSEAQPDLGG